MIVICPACDTRYLVDEEALGGTAGRHVRCANCGAEWHYAPRRLIRSSAITRSPPRAISDAPRSAELDVDGEPARTEFHAEVQNRTGLPAIRPTTAVAVKPLVAVNHRKAKALDLGLIIVAAILPLGATYLARNTIIGWWPPAEPAYAAIRNLTSWVSAIRLSPLTAKLTPSALATEPNSTRLEAQEAKPAPDKAVPQAVAAEEAMAPEKATSVAAANGDTARSASMPNAPPPPSAAPTASQEGIPVAGQRPTATVSLEKPSEEGFASPQTQNQRAVATAPTTKHRTRAARSKRSAPREYVYSYSNNGTPISAGRARQYDANPYAGWAGQYGPSPYSVNGP